jgi:hypothetical protein
VKPIQGIAVAEETQKPPSVTAVAIIGSSAVAYTRAIYNPEVNVQQQRVPAGNRNNRYNGAQAPPSQKAKPMSGRTVDRPTRRYIKICTYLYKYIYICLYTIQKA